MSDKIKSDDIFGLARHFRFQWEEAQGGYVLLFPEGMVKLNGSAGEVIKRMDGQKSVAKIIADCMAAFPEASDIEADVLAMLKLAQEKSWITKVA